MKNWLLFLWIVCFGCVPFCALGTSETYRQLNTFSEAFRHIRTHSLTPVSDEHLIHAAIQGMLQSVDSHSLFIRGKNFDALAKTLKGEMGGIGIEFEIRHEKIIIITAFQDSPAAQAGLKPGDEIIAINQHLIKGLSFTTIRERLKGTVGETIVLTIKRPQAPPSVFDVRLTRRKVKLPLITYTLKKNIACIHLAHFYQADTVTPWAATLKKIHNQTKGQLKGLILDLRNNPGGQIQHAIDIANTLIPNGIIVSLKERPPRPITVYRANGKTLLPPQVPLVVLVNKGTASAAEILAAALQDHKRALIMGERTYGKGSVQTITILPPGYSAIQLTTGEYLTPNGTMIQDRGILPDVMYEAPLLPGEDPLLDRAYQLLEEKRS